MPNLNYEYPIVWALIILFLICSKVCKVREQSIYFPHLKIFSSSTRGGSFFLSFLKYSAIITALIALSSPYSEYEHSITPKRGYDIAMILDTSASMKSRGFDRNNINLNRFDVVKDIVAEFVKKRENDNIGLIVFGEYSFVAAPLTFDKSILSKIIDRLYITMAGERTAIFDSLAQTANLFESAEAKSKLAILLTDGVNTAGTIPTDVAIKLLKKQNIKLYTVGIGGAGEFDEAMLMALAKETGGQFYKAYESSQLEKIYEEIDRLEKSEIRDNGYTFKEYYFQYPLAYAFFAFLFYIILRRKRGNA